jgi:hypothetical protein
LSGVRIPYPRLKEMPEPVADGKQMSIADRFRSHWFVSIFLVCCAVAVATWELEDRLVVSPLDSRIKILEGDLATKNSRLDGSAANPKIVLKRTWLNEGDSLTCDDGSCFIHIDHVTPSLDVDVSITVGADKPFHFTDVHSGRRLGAITDAARYYIDIHEIHDKQVGIEVIRESILKPTPK